MELLSIACPKLEKQALLPTYELVPLLRKDNKGVLLKIHGRPFVARGKLWEVIVGNGHLVTLYLPDVCLENAGVMSVCLTLVIMFSNVENIDLSVKKSRCSNSFNSRIEILAETGVHFKAAPYRENEAYPPIRCFIGHRGVYYHPRPEY